MTAFRKGARPVPVGDIAGDILDPVMRRRAGISIGLVQSWDEIVGPDLAAMTRPEKLAWPRRAHEDDPFEPAALVIACEGFAALRVQHETGEILSRINAFLGFAAVGRIRIVQKPVVREEQAKRAAPRPLTPDEDRRVAEVTAAIEDEGLRNALERLGRSVIGSKKPR